MESRAVSLLLGSASFSENVKSGLRMRAMVPRRPATSRLQRMTTPCQRVDEKGTLGTLRQRGKGGVGAAAEHQEQLASVEKTVQQSHVLVSHSCPRGASTS